jgi:gas vesicle protein
MDRITIGAALGGAAVYLLDPQRGADRRRRVQSFNSALQTVLKISERPSRSVR